jgi:hypothetical protein
MRKKAAKTLIVASVVTMFAAFTLGISFYYRGLPHTPQPEVGRIYPLNNHGYLLYMTHQEKVQQETSFVVFGVLFVVAALTEHFLDPFGRAGSERKRMKPWNHRWGP